MNLEQRIKDEEECASAYAARKSWRGYVDCRNRIDEMNILLPHWKAKDAELALLREQVRVLAEQEQEQTAVIKCIVDHHQDTNSGCPEGSTLKCDYDCHSCWVAWAKNHLNTEAKRRIAEREKGGEG